MKPQDPVKQAARIAVQRAIEAGTLVRPPTCSACSREVAVQGHHDDYSKPLDVRWLCVPCHNKHHNEQGWAPRTWTRRERTGMGARMESRRKALGLTVSDVQLRAGVSRLATVYELENGTNDDPKISTIIPIARVLGVTVEWLFDGAKPSATTEAA